MSVLDIVNPYAWVMKGIKGLAGIVSNTIIQHGNTQAAKEGAQDQRGADVVANYLSAANETNRIKQASRTERTVIAAFLCFVLPTAIHWWFVLLDSVPFFVPYFMDKAHKVGSWKVAAPPGKWADTYHMIIGSFFIAAPSIAGISILARMFRR